MRKSMRDDRSLSVMYLLMLSFTNCSLVTSYSTGFPGMYYVHAIKQSSAPVSLAEKAR